MKLEVDVLTPDDVRAIAKETFLAEMKELGLPELLYSRNQVAKALKMGNTRVQRLINEGVIKTTCDGKIPRSSVADYLKTANTGR